MSHIILRPLMNEDNECFGYDVARVPAGVDVDAIIEIAQRMGAENISRNILHVEDYEEVREHADLFDVWNQHREAEIMFDPALLEKYERRKGREAWDDWCKYALAEAVASWYMAE